MIKTIKNTQKTSRAAIFALLVATLALIVNFWAWSLISPLATQYMSELALRPIQVSILVALPVLIGSLGRIPLGLLTDKYGGKIIFSIVCLVAILPVVALARSSSYNELVLAAIFLGVGGAAFVIGIPFISAWFPPEKRGFVLGLYSMGNAGTAVSGFMTPRLAAAFGRQWAFMFVATLLLAIALVFIFVIKNAPGWKPAKNSLIQRFTLAAKNRLTWDLSIIYVITFGAFVAFGVYLPVLLKIAYGVSLTDAATRAAGFILLATLARPLGGWLSDKYGGQNVVRVVLVAIPIFAAFVAFQPSLQPATTAAYLSLAIVLGCGNGAVFALLGKLSEPGLVGSITGIVGAAGGLGGFLPPLILGFTYQKTNSFSLALLMLAISAVVVFLYINWRFKMANYWVRS